MDLKSNTYNLHLYHITTSHVNILINIFVISKNAKTELLQTRYIAYNWLESQIDRKTQKDNELIDRQITKVNRQTDRSIDRQIDRQLDRQRDRQTTKQTCIQTSKLIDRQVIRQIERQIYDIDTYILYCYKVNRWMLSYIEVYGEYGNTTVLLQGKQVDGIIYRSIWRIWKSHLNN